MAERVSNWTTASMARELALIRDILEIVIEQYMLFGRYPSPEAIQRQLHGLQKNDEPTPTPSPSE